MMQDRDGYPWMVSLSVEQCSSALGLPCSQSMAGTSNTSQLRTWRTFGICPLA